MKPVVITDAASGSSAQILVSQGFNCFDFRAVTSGGKTVDVIEAEDNYADGDKRPSANGIPLLFPFPNRIREGRFSWDGKDYHLPEDLAAYDGAGNAIHGFCYDRPWRVVEQNDNSVVGEFQLSVDAEDRLELWPADFIIRVTYKVQGTTLHADIEISNPDERPLPWGFGTHAYFKLPLSDDSDPKHCLVQAAAHEEWQLTDCLPDGTKRPVSDSADLRDGAYFDVIKLDDVLSDLRPEGSKIETKILDEVAGLQVVQRFDTNFRELVAFTPPWTTAVCLEPYTCVTDAINLEAKGVDAGWRVLAPGESFRTSITISVEPIMA